MVECENDIKHLYEYTLYTLESSSTFSRFFFPGFFDRATLVRTRTFLRCLVERIERTKPPRTFYVTRSCPTIIDRSRYAAYDFKVNLNYDTWPIGLINSSYLRRNVTVRLCKRLTNENAKGGNVSELPPTESSYNVSSIRIVLGR